jgi:hypothetical protein
MNIIRTSKNRIVTITKTVQFILFREVNAVDPETHTEPLNKTALYRHCVVGMVKFHGYIIQ